LQLIAYKKSYADYNVINEKDSEVVFGKLAGPVTFS